MLVYLAQTYLAPRMMRGFDHFLGIEEIEIDVDP